MSNLKENNYPPSPNPALANPGSQIPDEKKMSIIIPRTQIIIDYNYLSNLKERKNVFPLTKTNAR